MQQIHRSIYSPHHPMLPIYVETIGCRPNQETIRRPDGYPHFHWLQSVSGSGEMRRQGETTLLTEHSGVLLYPGEPHEYSAATDTWTTVYLTFDGPACLEVLRALGILESARFEWEPEAPCEAYLPRMIERIAGQHDADPFGIAASGEAYRFLLTLQTYGHYHKRTAIAGNLHTLQPLIDWLEIGCSDPNIGLRQMADKLDVSPRKLNRLFKETFQLTPYAYLLNMRIRKAKELLMLRPGLSVGEISGLVGFREPSHFVATFRRHVGLPPEQFRRMH